MLSGWVGVELNPYFGYGRIYFASRCLFLEKIAYSLEVLWGEHSGLRKCQLEYGVLRDIVPIDETVDDILIYPERENTGDHFHGKALLCGEEFKLRDVI